MLDRLFGRRENPQDSEPFFKCAVCGIPIRGGVFCECVYRKSSVPENGDEVLREIEQAWEMLIAIENKLKRIQLWVIQMERGNVSDRNRKY